MAPILGVVSAIPAVALTAGVAAVTAVGVGAVHPAKAATLPPVLVLAQNGESTAPETTILENAGYAVTQVTPAQWLAMTKAQFQSYAALVIGDPSSGSCSTLVPTTATSGTDAIGTTWQGAVTGNLAILGTAPVLPSTNGANTLIDDAIAYTAARWNSSSDTGTGLYESLNCEYSTAAANTSVPLLNGVEGISGAGGLTLQGSLACGDNGTVNAWEAANAGTFSGFTSGSLAAGAPGWPSPACPVQEAFDSWPGKSQPWSGTFTPLAYDAASDATANFTASDAATGQPYILLGSPSAPTPSLAPSTGGQVPSGTAAGGTGNPAVPGLAQPVSQGVNTENGDFNQSATDLSIPTYGPPLSFSRSYDSQLAQQQTQTGKPGPMGYGWTDNWASSLTTASPTPGDIYTIDGRRTNNGDGGAPTGVSGAPDTVTENGSDFYIVDIADNRIMEIPAISKTQWGRTMTAGDMYVVAGSLTGQLGSSASGHALSGFLLNAPEGLTFDSHGNMIISDSGNDRILVVPAASGTYFGVAMTAGDVYQIAGHTGTPGNSGDGAADTSSYLNQPTGVSVGHSGADLYIADTGNSRIQEIYEGSQSWGKTMTAGDIYTVAGQSSGASGTSGDGGAATSAYLNFPMGVSFSSSSDMYIADTGNNRVQEVAAATGTQWGKSMTANDVYTVAGQSSGASGNTGDGGAATSAYLNDPVSIEVSNGNQLYIADSGNNRIREVAQTTHTEWGISMTAHDIYLIAGNAYGICGFNGNGGAATSARLCYPVSVWVASSSMYIADEANNRVRQVNSSDTISEYAGDGWQVATAGNGGPAINAGLFNPEGEAFDSAGDVYIADAWNNRIQEIAAHNHTQFGISMTAGEVYTVAGNAMGSNGTSGDGGLATSAYLYLPQSIAADNAGNLYIADSDNCRIQEVAAATGNISTVAGSSAGTCGTYSSNGVAATSALLSQMQGVALDPQGDIFIADTFDNRVEEVYEGGQSFGQTMTKGDIYTVAGSGTEGFSGDGGVATSAKVYEPDALGSDGKGNLYISDWGNNRVREVPVVSGLQRGQTMTKNDIYTIAGNGTAGTAGNGGPATSANLNGPGNATVDPAGDLYISDTSNNRVQEVPAGSGTQWGQAMTANYVYTVAGSATGASGNSGDGGPAASAKMTVAENVSLDPEGDLYITDHSDNLLREVVSGTPATIAPAPGLTSAQYPAPGGITVTEPGGSQVTFYAQSGGACNTAPYTRVAGQYCALPEDAGASLTYNSGSGTWTFSPQPGSDDTFNSTGQLTSVSNAAGDTLTLSYGTPAPGAGNCPSSAASCETITSASGRSLILGLNSAKMITSVTDPMGRTWTYGYTGNDLTSVTDPMTNVTSYGYDTANTNPLLTSDITTITRPNGQTGGPDAGTHTAIAWNAAGQVTSVTDPMGYKTSYNLTGFNPSTGTGYITVTDADGNTTAYYYALGTLAAKSVWNGAVGSTLATEQDYVPDQTITSGDNSAGTQLDVAAADGDGNLTTTSYDSSGNSATITSPGANGTPATTTTAYTASLQLDNCDSTATAATTATCQQDAPPAPVAAGAVITAPSSAPPSGVTYTLYDTNGNELYATTGVYEPGATAAAYTQTNYQLFKGNSVTLNGTTITCTATPPSPSLPCAKINANGVVNQLGYDSAGDLTSSSTPDGNSGGELATTTYGYDSDGEQTSTTSPDGNLSGANTGNYTTITAWNNDGQKISVAQGDGTGHTVTPRVTNYGHDGDGNGTTVQDARGYTTTTTFDADDQPTLVTDPDSHATLTCYDGDGHVTQTVPPVGVAANSLTSSSCPTSYPSGYGERLASDATTYSFDGLGQKTRMTTPAPAGQSGSETTSYTYDANGNLVQTTAPPTTNGGQGQVTVATYTSTGQLASQTTGYGTSTAATTSYCYDPGANKTAVVYGDGNTSGPAPCESSSPWVVSSSAYPTQASYQTTYTYDSVGEQVSVTTPATAAAPAGSTTTKTYDAVGNVLTRTDPNGVATTWTYTPLNLTASVSYSGGSAHSVSYGYDASGNKTSMSDATGLSSFIYDPFGELTSGTNGAGQVTDHGYNADGQANAITYPLPATATWASTDTVSYIYDNADHLTGVTDFTGRQIGIGDTPDGLPSSVTLGTTGDTIATTYSPTDVAATITLYNNGGTLQSFGYSNSPAGTVLSETDTPSSPQSPATYSYDAQGQVTSMTAGSGPAQSYGFDASGNLTTLPTEDTGSYDHAGELISASLSGTTTSYSYDANGERLSAAQGGSTIASGTWNGAEQLTSYNDAAVNMSAVTYDGNGLRATATSGTGSQSFVWNNVSSIPQLIMDSGNAYIYTLGVAPAEQVNLSTGAISYLITDSLGSVRGVVSGSGTLSATTSYDTWGNPETAGGLSASTPFGYAGGYTDPTGLVYLINRYYDPGAGQFLSVDPMLTETQQAYEYANGNPVSLTDALGESFSGVAVWGSFCIWGYCIVTGVEWATVYGGGLDVYSANVDWHTGWLDAWSFSVWVHKPGHTFGEWRSPVFGHTTLMGGVWIPIHHTFPQSANYASICVQLWDHYWGQMLTQVCGTMYD